MNTVIFDLDGTLLDTLEDLADAVNFAMRSFSLDEKNISQVRSYVGNGIRKLIERCVPGGESREDFEEILQCFREYYGVHCQDKTKPYEGILELLQELKQQGYQMAIVSNKHQSAVEELRKIFFAQWIEVAIGQREDLHPKPAADTVNLALDMLGCDREDAIYIGDSEVDKATADNSGMDCIAVTWGFRDKELLAGLNPAVVVESPGQILEYLNGRKEREGCS